MGGRRLLATVMLAGAGKRYPRYRDSGVEWIGEIPKHWRASRLKFAAPIRASKLASAPSGETYVGLENIEPRTGRLLLDDAGESEPESTVGWFAAGDVLLGKLRPNLGKVARPAADGMGTTELVALQPAACSQGFLFYALLSKPLIDWWDRLTFGAKMPRVSPEQIANTFVPVPPEKEQRAIAGFLDRETARVDALIERQKGLVDLLKEQRTALISRSVTRGLVAGVAMKDTGVEWLGDIPVHWDVWRLKHLLSKPLMYGASESGCAHDPSLPRYVRITDINPDGSLREDGLKSISEELGAPYLLSEDDILFARSGSVGLTARCKPAWGRSAFAGYLVRARLNARADPAFVEYFTRSAHYGRWVLESAIQATILNVSAERYNGLPVPMPSVSEQRLIADFLDHETAKIDALVAKVQEAIERLHEFRQALICAAVTGSIDVRGEVAQ